MSGSALGLRSLAGALFVVGRDDPALLVDVGFIGLEFGLQRGRQELTAIGQAGALLLQSIGLGDVVSDGRGFVVHWLFGVDVARQFGFGHGAALPPSERI